MSDEISNQIISTRRRAYVKYPLEYASQRLDAALVKLFPDYSRSRLQQWIKAERVTLDGASPRGRDKLIGGEQLELRIEHEALDEVQSGGFPLDIIYEG